jgi:hypothetical protein
MLYYENSHSRFKNGNAEGFFPAQWIINRVFLCHACWDAGTENGHTHVYCLRMKESEAINEEIIAYFSLMLHGPHRKRLQHFFVAAKTSLPRYLATIGDTQTRVQQFYFVCFRAAVTLLPIHCLATKGGIHVHYRAVIWLKRFAKYKSFWGFCIF